MAKLHSDPAEQRGGEEFAGRYGPKIEIRCRGWGLLGGVPELVGLRATEGADEWISWLE